MSYRPSYWDQSHQYNDGNGGYYPTPQAANVANAYYRPYDPTGGYVAPAPVNNYQSPLFNNNPSPLALNYGENNYDAGNNYNVENNYNYQPIRLPKPGKYIKKKMVVAKDFVVDEVVHRGQNQHRDTGKNPWIKDDYIGDDKCDKCNCDLKYYHKRHHCRKCGKHFCRSCLKMRNWKHANHIKRWKSASSTFAALGRRVLICKKCMP